jgi:hypothetical protein
MSPAAAADHQGRPHVWHREGRHRQRIARGHKSNRGTARQRYERGGASIVRRCARADDAWAADRAIDWSTAVISLVPINVPDYLR